MRQLFRVIKACILHHAESLYMVIRDIRPTGALLPIHFWRTGPKEAIPHGLRPTRWSKL